MLALVIATTMSWSAAHARATFGAEDFDIAVSAPCEPSSLDPYRSRAYQISVLPMNQGDRLLSRPRRLRGPPDRLVRRGGPLHHGGPGSIRQNRRHGASNCAQFLQDIETNPGAERDYFAWAQGYMSGLLIRAPTGKDEDLDLTPSAFPLSRQAAILRSFCTTARDADLSDAVNMLYRTLRAPPG